MSEPVNQKSILEEALKVETDKVFVEVVKNALGVDFDELELAGWLNFFSADGRICWLLTPGMLVVIDYTNDPFGYLIQNLPFERIKRLYETQIEDLLILSVEVDAGEGSYGYEEIMDEESQQVTGRGVTRPVIYRVQTTDEELKDNMKEFARALRQLWV